MAAIDPSEQLRRDLVTPEGVNLHIRLASAGQRAGAFVIDCLLLGLALVAFTILMFAAGVGSYTIGGTGIAAIIWLIGSFLLRNFYFIYFETGRRAATPGKRWAGLRVVARDGGRLTGDAVVARNLMRELEVFLPLSLFGFAPDVDGVIRLVGFAWAAIFLFFPLFNRDRLRAGDILAGTWVVQAPRRELLADLGAEGREKLDRFAFTAEQIAVYGEYELQTLETVLRSDNEASLQAVSDTIRAKIGWRDGDDDREFLSAYYAALRAKLQRGMLLGRRRRDKHDNS